jgi:hypothetical protein
VPFADTTGRVKDVRVDAGIVSLSHGPFALTPMVKNAAGSEAQQDRVVRPVSTATYRSFARRGSPKRAPESDGCTANAALS